MSDLCEILAREIDLNASKSLKVKNLAERVTGKSYNYIRKQFVKKYSMTISCYHNNALLKKAINHLEDESFPVIAISYDLGFFDDSHFIKWLKKATGKIPADYRVQGQD